jgi:hypothetical protein
MTSIDRTVYPRLSAPRSAQALSEQYRRSEEEMAFVIDHTDETPTLRLSLVVQLKTFQQLGYFLPVTVVPAKIIAHHCVADTYTLDLEQPPEPLDIDPGVFPLPEIAREGVS